MSSGTARRVSEALPDETWNTLANNASAALIDVRTQAEWTFVGVPDLESIGHSVLLIEWASYPGMSKNPQFADAVIEALGPDLPGTLFFLCRSGARSLAAGQSVAQHLAERGLSAECVNVAEGFEGDVDSMGHRGRLNGWKARGLAWRQS